MMLNQPETQDSVSFPTPTAPARKPKPLRRFIVRGLIGLSILTALVGVGSGVLIQVTNAQRREALSQLQTVAVKRVTLPLVISANGSVEPKQATNVSPKTSGRLERVLVNEGDVVEAGQILAYMDDSDLQGQRIQAEGQLKAAEANLALLKAGNRPQEIAQAQADVASAEASLRQAEDDLRRYEQLYSNGAISAQEVSTYRTSRDSAQAKLDAANQALSLRQAGSRPQEITQAEAQITQAQGNLDTIQTQIADAVIRAPFSGVVTARYADPGDFVAPSMAASSTSSATSSSILTLASTYQMVANVAEKDIAKIRPGQTVTITTDAYPDQTFTGRVDQVAEQATVTANVTSFKVRVHLDDPQRKLSPGMNGSLDFQVGERNNALVVPSVAIARQASGEGVTVMVPDGPPRFVSIKTGITVGNQTEVISGLTGNEQIVINAMPSPENAPENGPSIFPPPPERMP